MQVSTELQIGSVTVSRNVRKEMIIMTGNRFFGPSGDGFLNTESFVDILDEIGKMNKHYTVDIKKQKDMEEVTIKNVIFNPPATIVFWSNGDKTVVKCDEIEKFDPEKGMAMAISKHALGNKGNYYNEFIKYAGEYIRKTFDDYGKAIAKGFKDSINKDFNERFAKSGVEK